jgi:hypothetical protein
MGLFYNGKSDGICMNFTSSGARPRLLQNASKSKMVALIIKILLHFSKNIFRIFRKNKIKMRSRYFISIKDVKSDDNLL